MTKLTNISFRPISHALIVDWDNDRCQSVRLDADDPAALIMTLRHLIRLIEYEIAEGQI